MPDQRFPPENAKVKAASESVVEALRTMHNGPPPFKYVEADGKTPVACYAPFSYTPEVCHEFFAIGKLSYGPGGPNSRNRELAILAMCSIIDAPFIVYSHRPIAKKVGLTEEQFEDAIRGKMPNGLSESERAAYRLGIVLTNQTGRMDDETWAEFSSKLDRLEIVGLIHFVGAYRWVSLLEQVNGDFRDWSAEA
ncbi:hypothetical protein V2G26_012174 [Clonostachys chloroleuca]